MRGSLCDREDSQLEGQPVERPSTEASSTVRAGPRQAWAHGAVRGCWQILETATTSAPCAPCSSGDSRRDFPVFPRPSQPVDRLTMHRLENRFEARDPEPGLGSRVW